MNKQFEDSMTLELKILSKHRPRPQMWNQLPGPTFNSSFPSTPPSIRRLKYSNKSFSYSELQETETNILRKRKMLPFLNPGWHHAIDGLILSKMSSNIKTRRLLLILNKICKEAKNLKSLILQAKCGISNLKGIRRARTLQDLSLKIETELILAYPQLFKYLPSLQRAELHIQWSNENPHENIIIDKFFGSLLNLPKLWHLTLWLDDSFGYYKALLFEINKRKLPSFQVIVQETFQVPLKKCLVDWNKCIETVYIGSELAFLTQAKSWDMWPHAKFPEKRLRLKSPSKIEDLIEIIPPIKSLEIDDLFSCQGYPSVESLQKVFVLISKAKALEKLTLTIEMTFKNYNEIQGVFNKEFSQIDPLEKLSTFRFELQNNHKFFPLISPPYGEKMKNLKTLSLTLDGPFFNLSEFTKALKCLGSLENFSFTYHNSTQEGEVKCRFPFECMKNLKLIRLHCNRPFGEDSIKQFIRSVSELENLKSLKIFGKILHNLDRKASAVAKDLCSSKRLEVVSFEWKEAKPDVRTFVNLLKTNGAWIASIEKRE